MVQLIAQFRDVDGNDTGPQVYLPSDTTPQQLQGLINDLLENVRCLRGRSRATRRTSITPLTPWAGRDGGLPLPRGRQ